jgi:hypothetical protein
MFNYFKNVYHFIFSLIHHHLHNQCINLSSLPYIFLYLMLSILIYYKSFRFEFLFQMNKDIIHTILIDLIQIIPTQIPYIYIIIPRPTKYQITCIYIYYITINLTLYFLYGKMYFTALCYPCFTYHSNPSYMV